MDKKLIETKLDLMKVLWDSKIKKIEVRSKADLMNAVFGKDYTGIDSALPQAFVDHMVDDHDIDVRFSYCLDYRGVGRAKLVNLSEEILKQINDGKYILVKVPEE